MIKIGIIGGAGYTAGELIRILVNHPEAEITFVHSTSNAGNKIYDVHEGLFGEIEMSFSSEMPFDEIDVLYLCSGHGFSTKFLAEHNVPKEVKIIDLSHDFRDETNGFVYGSPELNRERIKNCTRLANPGCFATAIEICILPLAANGLLNSEVHVNGITGSTGAGVKPSSTGHFSWRNNNVSVYKAFGHQHLSEIKRSLTQLQTNFDQEINFIPVRGDFARGIFVSCYLDCDLDLPSLSKIYGDFYEDAEFTFMTEKNPNLKQVVNTNKGIVYLEKHGNKLLVLSIIDNLLKGASGQAVQNMNLMFGLEESTGLRLKSIAF